MAFCPCVSWCYTQMSNHWHRGNHAFASEIFLKDKDVLVTTQQIRDAIITSLLCRNDVATSFRRINDVIIASRVRWLTTAKTQQSVNDVPILPGLFLGTYRTTCMHAVVAVSLCNVCYELSCFDATRCRILHIVSCGVVNPLCYQCL